MVEKEILIYGAGGAGREFAFSLSLDRTAESSWNIKGFIDDAEHLWGSIVNDIKVLGGREYLKKYSGNVAMSLVGNPDLKRQIISKIKRESIGSIKFPLLISTNSIVSPLAEWGEGCIVSLPYNFISPNTKFGDFVFVNCGNRIGHDAIIGDFTTIFSDTDISGGVLIGSGCVIGSGVTVLPNVKIGDGSIIGGGSLVSKDIPQKVVAAGVPAKILREIKS